MESDDEQYKSSSVARSPVVVMGNGGRNECCK